VKIPKNLDVLGKDYSIKEVTEKELPKETGECYYWLQCILLDKNLRKDSSLETLLHEVIHAVDGELGLGLKEGQVRLLSQGLYSVLKHNPETWRLIWRKR
jgi:hypothetical protein